MTTATKTKLAPVVLIVPQGTRIRTKDRKTHETIKLNTEKSIKLTGNDVGQIMPARNGHTKIVSFQYKGRTATVKLRDCVGGRE